MALPLNPSFKSRTNDLLYEPLYFQRKKDKKRARKKRIRKKINLKFGHIFLFFLLIGGIFFFLQKLFILLISWDYLNIREIKIICSREDIKKEIEYTLKEKRLGNILLADITHLQQTIKEHKWVKDAYIRKIFPASLRIDIKERKPVAILKKENYYLIDENGNLLEKIYSTENLGLPLLIDADNFQKNGEEKLKLAWKCLKSSSPAEKEKIKALDLSYYGWVTLYLKDKKTRLILGYNDFAQKLKYFHELYENLEARFGPLEYVDLRFQDRLYIKPQENPNRSIIPNSKKEAL